MAARTVQDAIHEDLELCHEHLQNVVRKDETWRLAHAINNLRVAIARLASLLDPTLAEKEEKDG